MLRVEVVPAHSLGIASLRISDRAAILAFVTEHRELLQGRTLDWGCGLQPYRHLCGADYLGYDLKIPEHSRFPNGKFDAILCTVAFQEFGNPISEIAQMRAALKKGGHLLMVYHPNWREVEPADHWRISMSGMVELTHRLQVVWHEPMLKVRFADFAMNFTCGYVGVALDEYEEHLR